VRGKKLHILQDRNGIKYEVNKEEPFTGKYVDHYDDGGKKGDIFYVKGIVEELCQEPLKGCILFIHANADENARVENYL